MNLPRLFFIFCSLLFINSDAHAANNSEGEFDTSAQTIEHVSGHWVSRIMADNIQDFGLKHSGILVLTYDDGPGDGTAHILDLLEENHVEAAFFSIGKNAKTHPELLRRERSLRDGGRLQNIVGNHSYTHPELDSGAYTKRPMALYDQLIETDRSLRDILGENDFFNQSNGMLFFRAPFGAWSHLDAKIIHEKIKKFPEQAQDLQRYRGPIYWNIGGEIACGRINVDGHPERCEGKPLTDAADWDCWDHHMTPERCAEGYMNKIKSEGGGVVLSHDIYKNTAKMWEIIFPKLKSLGIKRIIRLDKIEANSKYHIPKSVFGDTQSGNE